MIELPRAVMMPGTGTWSNDIDTRWLDDGRSMLLLADVTYTDSHGRLWHAYEGEIVDGASIPRPLWAIVGSPFVGPYRKASVMHDVYCKRKERPSPEVHAMFWDAMFTDDTPRLKAVKMGTAVSLFGPRFEAIAAESIDYAKAA